MSRRQGRRHHHRSWSRCRRSCRRRSSSHCHRSSRSRSRWTMSSSRSRALYEMQRSSSMAAVYSPAGAAAASSPQLAAARRQQEDGAAAAGSRWRGGAASPYRRRPRDARGLKVRGGGKWPHDGRSERARCRLGRRFRERRNLWEDEPNGLRTAATRCSSRRPRIGNFCAHRRLRLINDQSIPFIWNQYLPEPVLS